MPAPEHPLQIKYQNAPAQLEKLTESWNRGILPAMRQALQSARAAYGFSLVEILIVLVVLVILSSLLIPQISKVTESSQISIARQQQVELQTALGNWIAAQSSGPGGLAAARAAYTGNKLALVGGYLSTGTYAALSGNGDNVTSAALNGAKATLQFSSWSLGAQPTVNWVNN